MRFRVLITGGGTGGHIYPALSVIRQLGEPSFEPPSRDQPEAAAGVGQPEVAPRGDRRANEPCELHYLGNSRGMEGDLLGRTGVPCFLFPMSPPSSLRGILLLAFATLRSLGVILRSRPRATFATGGYVSTPAAFASWLLRVPVTLFSPDVVPGRAVEWLVPLARRIAVSADDAVQYLPVNKVVVTGYPVREDFASVTRPEGRTHFGFSENLPVVCVFGGSQGSRSINQSLAASLPQVLSQAFVLHICGEKRIAEARDASASLTPAQKNRYRLFPYLHDREIALALAAADLAICRSGASTLGELPATGTPAVLVPLPERAVHQLENARYLERNGAAFVVEDAELRRWIATELASLLGDHPRLEGMAKAATALARPDAARRIAGLLQSGAA